MSNTVDKKVVEMQFNNAQFESGVKTSMTTLEKLKEALNFSNTTTGLEQVQRKFASFDLSTVAANIDYLANRFSTLGVVGMTAVQNITNKVMDLGTTIGTKLVNQIKTGGIARYQNIAQAKFQIEGLKKDWEKLYEDMDYAVDGTAYGIDEAATVAAQLSASGIEAGEGMKASLRGVSGVAAMTNSTYSEIGHIFTTIAGNGRLMGMQLTQLSTKGLNVAATLAEQLGTTEQEIREMVSKGEIDFETFANAMDSAFGEHATEANKTFTGALSNMKAALSRIGENFARPIFENMIEPLNTLRDVFNEVKGKFVSFTGSLTDDSWKHSSYGLLMERLSGLMTNMFKNMDLSWLDKWISHLDKLATVINYVINQYANNDGLIATIKKYYEFHNKLDGKTQAMINVLQGLANIVQAVKNIFVAFYRVIKIAFGVFEENTSIESTSSAFLSLTESLLKISESFSVSYVRALKFGKAFRIIYGYIKKFASIVVSAATSLGEVLAPIISSVIDILLDLIVSLSKVTVKFVDFLKENINVEHTAGLIKKAYAGVKGVFTSVGNVVKNLIQGFVNLQNGTKGAITTITSLLILGSVFIKQTTPVVMAFKSLVWTVQGSLNTIKNLSKALSGLSNFTKYVGYALIIKEIAIAVAIFAGSLALLTLVDSSKLKGATVAIASLMVIMTGMIALLSFFVLKLKDAEHAGSYLISMGVTILAFAASIGILAAAVAKLASADVKKAWNGVAILVTTIVALSAAAIVMSNLAPFLSKGSVMLIAFAAAVYILTVAIERLSKVNVDNIQNQLVALALVMLSLIAIAKLAVGIPWTGAASILAMVISLWLVEKTLNNIVNNGVSFDVLKQNLDKFAIALLSLFVLSKLVNRFSAISGTVKSALFLVAFAVALTLIMKSFASLVNMTQGQSMSNAILGMVLIFGGITYLLKQLAVTSEFAKGSGKMILQIGVAILLISASLALLSRVKNPMGLLMAVSSIGIILYMISEVLEQVSKNVEKTHVFSILSMVLMVVAIATSLGLLTFLADSETKLLAAAGAMSLILITLAESLRIIGDVAGKFKLNGLQLLRTGIIAIIAIAVSLTILSSVKDTDKLGYAVGALLMTMISMAALMLLFSKFSEGIDIKRLELFDVAVATLIIVATSLVMLNQFESVGKLYATVGALSLCLFAVALTVIGLAKLGNNISVKAIVGLGVAVLSLIVVASTLKMLLDGEYDWEDMKHAIIAMVAVLGSVVVALSLLAIVTHATSGVATLLAGAVIIASLLALSYVMKTLAGTVRTLTSCLAMLTKLDYDSIRIDILTELCNVLLGFGLKAAVAGVGLFVFGAALTVIGVAMLTVAAAVAIIVPNIVALTKALMQLGLYGPMVANGIKAVGKSVSETIKQIAAALIAAFVNSLVQLASFSQLLVASCTVICDSIIQIATLLIVGIAGVLVRGLEALLKEIDEHLPNILTSLKSIIVTCLKFLVQMIPTLAYTGGLMISGFLIGVFRALEQKLPEITDASVELALSIVWAITDALYEHQDDIVDAIKGLLDVIGLTVLNMLDTLTGGLLSKMDWYKGTMDELGAEIEEMSARRGKREAEANTNAFIEETETSKDKIKDAKTNSIADTTEEQAKAGNKDASSYVSGAIDKLADGDINDAMMDEWMNSDSINIEDFASKYSSDVTESTAEGIKENSSVVTDAFSNMPAEAAEEMRKHGVDLETVGADMNQSVADGVESSDATTEGASSAFDKILGVFNSEDSTAKLNSSGSNSIGQYVTGLISGAEDSGNQSKLKTAVQNMVQTNVVDATNETLDVNSPSKVAIAIGKYWDLGLGQGITEYGKVIYSASEETANNLSDTFTRAFNNVNKGIDGNFQYTPTITPVVDMTNVERASNWLQSAFNNDASIRMAEDSTLSIQNGSSNSLAQQVALLSDQVSKLADTDYSKLLEGVSVNVDARTTVDGAELRTTSAKYTAQVINDEQRKTIMAMGGMI